MDKKKVVSVFEGMLFDEGYQENMRKAARHLTAETFDEYSRCHMDEIYDKDADGNFRLVVTTPSHVASYNLFQTVTTLLTLFPKDVEIHQQDFSMKTIQQFSPLVRLWAQNLYMRIEKFPEIFKKDETGLNTMKCPTARDIAAKLGDFPLACTGGTNNSPAIIINGSLGCEDIEANSIIPCPATFGHELNKTVGTTTMTQRVLSYIVFSHYTIENDTLRDVLQQVSLEQTIETELLLVDSILGGTRESTLRNKLAILLKWYDFLLLLPEVRVLICRDKSHEAKAFKIAQVIKFVIENKFLNKYFIIFSQLSTNKKDTDENYFKVILQIYNAALSLDFQLNHLSSPKDRVLKVNPRKRLKETTKKQASTNVPIDLWLKFVSQLYHSPNLKICVFAHYMLLNLLCASRYEEIIKYPLKKFKCIEVTIGPGKQLRALPIQVRTKTGLKKLFLPVLPKWPLLNLELVLTNFQSFCDSQRPLKFSSFHDEMTNDKFNTLLNHFWNQFIKQKDVFFPPQNAIITTHSLRKLSTLLYTEKFHFPLEFVKLILGHTLTSETLQKVYMKKEFDQVQYESYHKAFEYY